MGRPMTSELQTVGRGRWTVSGKVAAAGTVSEGEGFSAGTPSSSVYTLTFHASAPRLISFTVSAVSGKAEIHTDFSQSARTIKVATFNNDGTTAADKIFYFTAVFSDATPRP